MSDRRVDARTPGRLEGIDGVERCEAERARTSGRRSGGSVLGGWRRCGTSASRCSVMCAIFSAASSIAAATSPFGFVTPDTLRTN